MIDQIVNFAAQALPFLNYSNEAKKLDYTKWQQQQQMQREDSAYQRAMADMKKAGINPIMAGGTHGSASTPVAIGEAPKFEGSPIEKQIAFQTLQNERAKNSVIQAEAKQIMATTENIRMQTQKTQNEMPNISATLQKLLNETEATKISNIYNRWANNKDQSIGITPRTDTASKFISSLEGNLDKISKPKSLLAALALLSLGQAGRLKNIARLVGLAKKPYHLTKMGFLKGKK